MMQLRPLGRTGIRVSEIGFGGWGIGGVNDGATSYGPVDDAESERALRRAFDHGINIYDTADLYGHGHSETVLGRAFRHDRDRVVFASKVGFLDTINQDFSAAHIRRSIDGSLKRLQTDYLDIYQLHNPPLAAMVADDEALVEMSRLRRDGKVREFGISVASPADGLKAIDGLGAAVIQVNFNMIDQRAIDSGLLRLCVERKVGVIIRTPLCYGFLTGKYADTDTFGGGDHRGGWSTEQRRVWAAAPEIFETVRARKPAQTRAHLALRYILSYPEVSTVIPGMLTPTQVDENAAASAMGPLDANDRATIEHLYQGRRFFLGRDAVARPVAAQ